MQGFVSMEETVAHSSKTIGKHIALALAHTGKEWIMHWKLTKLSPASPTSS
ncbi:MAG: hypothetical protein WA364_19115 [Candidatus Nitrosopolaris sp.]